MTQLSFDEPWDFRWHEESRWTGPIIRLETPTSKIEEYATSRQRHKRSEGITNSRIDRRNHPLVTEMHGFYGEFAIAQYYSELLDRDIRVNLQNTRGGDGGVDFWNIREHTVDAKFSAYPAGDLYFTHYWQFKAQVAILVVPTHKNFLRQEHPVFRLAGWIDKQSFWDDHIHHEPKLEDEPKTTWQGDGKTQTSIPVSCLKCDYHANSLRKMKRL